MLLFTVSMTNIISPTTLITSDGLHRVGDICHRESDKQRRENDFCHREGEKQRRKAENSCRESDIYYRGDDRRHNDAGDWYKALYSFKKTNLNR